MKIKNKLLYLLGVVGLTFAVGFNAFDSKVVKADNVVLYDCTNFYTDSLEFELTNTIDKFTFTCNITSLTNFYAYWDTYSLDLYTYASTGDSYIEGYESYTESYISLGTKFNVVVDYSSNVIKFGDNGYTYSLNNADVTIGLSYSFISNTKRTILGVDSLVYASCSSTNLNSVDYTNTDDCIFDKILLNVNFDGIGYGNFGYQIGYDDGYDDGYNQYPIDRYSNLPVTNAALNFSAIDMYKYSTSYTETPWAYNTLNGNTIHIEYDDIDRSNETYFVVVKLYNLFYFKDMCIQFYDGGGANKRYFSVNNFYFYSGVDYANFQNDTLFSTSYNNSKNGYVSSSLSDYYPVSAFVIKFSNPSTELGYYFRLDINVNFYSPYLDNMNVYDVGYSDGVSDGYTSGYNNGYAVAQNLYEDEDERVTSIFNGISSIALLPIDMFLKMFNFELFGIDMSVVVTAILSICVVIAIIKLVKGL